VKDETARMKSRISSQDSLDCFFPFADLIGKLPGRDQTLPDFLLYIRIAGMWYLFTGCLKLPQSALKNMLA
jgi:hypothetical protein